MAWNPFRRDSKACATPGARKRNVLLVALLCAHCSLTAAAALAAVLLAGAPSIFGVGLEWVLPPFFILGLFLILVWPRRDNQPHESTSSETNG